MSKPYTDIDRQFGLPEGFLSAVWQQESSNGTNMLSPKGARGHFQFMPATRDEILKQSGFDAFSHDAETAAKAAGFYFSKLHHQFGGDIKKTLAAYNWGMGNLSSKGLANAPKETRDYMRDILTRINLKEELNFSQQWDAGQIDPNSDKAKNKRKDRRGWLSALGYSQEELDRMDQNNDIMGSAFIQILVSIISAVMGIDREPKAEPAVQTTPAVARAPQMQRA